MNRALVGVLLLLGCSSINRHVREPGGPLPIAGVVVYPVRLTGGEPAPDWHVWEFNARLMATAVSTAGERLPLFGPSEFQVTRWEDEGAWVASNVVPLLVRSGVSPEKALVLRITAERRVASHTQEAQDAKGRARAGSSTAETTWVCTAELLHPSSRLVLAELSGEVVLDPFAEPDREAEFDPDAPMTRLVEKLVAEALEVALKYAVPREAPAPLVTLAESPARTASFPDPAVVRLDPLAAELWMQNRARFLTPSLDDRQASKLATLGPGLWVLDAPASAGVQPGDLITQVDGLAPERQILARRRLEATPVQVRVKKGGNGAEVDTTVP